MKIIGEWGLPGWLIAIIASIVAIILMVRMHLDDAFLGLLRRFGEGVVRGEHELANMGAVGRAWNSVRGFVNDYLYRYVREFVDFIFLPLHPERLHTPMIDPTTGEQAVKFVGDREIPQFLYGIKNMPGWDIIFTVAAVFGVTLTCLGFYKSVFPRKYEYQSRDYSKEKKAW